jgi:hypothetical protein
MEFECAFVALDIDVRREDLRRFISLTDTNKDGKVDFKEFNLALNAHEMFTDEEYMQASVDLEASIEHF